MTLSILRRRILGWTRTLRNGTSVTIVDSLWYRNYWVLDRTETEKVFSGTRPKGEPRTPQLEYRTLTSSPSSPGDPPLSPSNKVWRGGHWGDLRGYSGAQVGQSSRRLDPESLDKTKRERWRSPEWRGLDKTKRESLRSPEWRWRE